ncbi:MAG TPA: BamA/TamA family outer membrane protein [Stenomitos sp.]
MTHRTILLAGLAWGLLSPAALAQGPGPSSLLGDSYGSMTPRYQRCLRFKPGGSELDWARTRDQFMRLRNIQDVAFRRVADGIRVEVVEHPVTSLNPMVIPWIPPVGVEALLQDWHVGGQYYDLRAFLGYNWSTLTIYDPARLTPIRLGELIHNYPEAALRWGMLVAPYTRLYLEGRAIDGTMVGDPAIASGFGSMRGPALTGSTFLRYDDADDPDIPTDGNRAKLKWLVGPQALGNPADYQRVEAYYQRYWSLSEDGCLAFGANGGFGLGDLPLSQTFRVGSADYTRGYDANRFVGNQFVALSLEYRHVLWRNLLNSGLTLHGAAFTDVGRCWNAGAGVPFPQDVRPAAGVYGGLSLGNWYIGRLEAAMGTEGLVVHLGTGLPFPW